MRWGAFTVEVAADGAGFRLLHGSDEWATFSLHGVRPSGRFTDDDDEVEHAFGCSGCSFAVRHSVGQHWTIRWALSAAEPSELVQVPSLRVRPGQVSVVWAWAAGAEAVLVVAPSSLRSL